MTVELRPLGVHCNIRCHYCYQNPQRDAGNQGRGYDLEAMKAAIEAEGRQFALFGGEPLLLPIEDLEHLFAWGVTRFGRNSVQTNGTVLEDAHVRLFRDYNVHVGVSMDGPGPLNDVRWAGTLEKTREATRRAEQNLARLCREGISTSLIVTLHRGNATADRLHVLHGWLRRLREIGVRAVRLHLLEVEDERIRREYALSAAENVAALRSFAEIEQELLPMKLDVFREMVQLLQGRDDRVSCVWRACDPYTTAAVRGVEGQGQRSNCGRTNKDGIDFAKADTPGYERYIALYHTPQEHGGCHDCRFFLMCRGHCPGTALDRDFRNRTEHCEVWKELYTELEAEMVARGEEPFSLRPELPIIEAAMLRAWSQGENPPLARIAAVVSDAIESSRSSSAPSGEAEP